MQISHGCYSAIDAINSFTFTQLNQGVWNEL